MGRTTTHVSDGNVSTPVGSAPGRIVAPNLVEQGSRLVGRYRLEERLGEAAGTTYWRAVDETLSRTVTARTLAEDSGHAERVLAAARAAAVVHDHRFLRVLDASTDGGVIYVISEWVEARNLGTVLQEGPLPAPEAARIVAEASEALASAHVLGLSHQCLVPESVLIADSGQVKLVGLAVDAAVQGIAVPDLDSARAADTRGCGALLYAALTGKWPGVGDVGLPAAPLEHGRPCTPRQVRAGVPAELDLAATRAMAAPHAVDGGSVTSPGVLAETLDSSLSGHRERARAWRGWDDGFRENRDDTELHAAMPWVTGTNPGLPVIDPVPTTGRATRVLRWSVAAVLAGGLALGGWQVVGAANGGAPSTADVAQEPEEPALVTEVPTGGREIPVESVLAFDPPPDGNGEENSEDAANVLDGDAATGWNTLTYEQQLGPDGLKEGVGLLLDLGSPQQVGAVQMQMTGPGAVVELRAADRAGAAAGDFEIIATGTDVGRLVTLRPESPVETRYLLVWLTDLPQLGGDAFRAGVTQVDVRN